MGPYIDGFIMTLEKRPESHWPRVVVYPVSCQYVPIVDIVLASFFLGADVRLRSS